MKLKTCYFLTVVWALMIMVLSLIPPSSLPSMDWSDFLAFDKIAHLAVYAVLSLLISLYSSQKGIAKWAITAIIFSSLYGLLMEVLQFVIYTGRNFEFLDIIANIIGSFLGTIFFNFLGKYFNKWKV